MQQLSRSFNGYGDSWYFDISGYVDISIFQISSNIGKSFFATQTLSCRQHRELPIWICKSKQVEASWSKLFHWEGSSLGRMGGSALLFTSCAARFFLPLQPGQRPPLETRLGAARASQSLDGTGVYFVMNEGFFRFAFGQTYLMNCLFFLFTCLLNFVSNIWWF